MPAAVSRALRLILSIAASLVGLALILLAWTGGELGRQFDRCPPGLVYWDGFWIGTSGAELAVGVPMLLARPSLRRLRSALIAAAIAGLLIGLACSGTGTADPQFC